MPTDLAQHIAATPLHDTHEHLRKEAEYVERGPDILQSLFDNYVQSDLIVAGASPQAQAALMDASNPDVRGRLAGILPAFQAVRHTGYGEAVRLIAKVVYDIDDLTPEAVEAAVPRHAALRQPGQRLRLIREQANIDHVQTDDFSWPCLPDASGPDFFFYDLSWWSFCKGTPELDVLAQETGVEVDDLDSMRQAMTGLCDKYARVAIAMKAQHAYERTLHWEPRSDADAAKALAAYLRNPKEMSLADRLCLGDWCWTRGVELSIEYNLPFKIHTGHYAGTGRMPVDYLRAGNLWELLSLYPKARFVLMHTAYPYSDELVSITKHYPNVYADLCWAWSIDPYSTSDFLRRCLHAVPANKIFVFGGDTAWPATVVAYTAQARRWLTWTLQAEVDDGLLTEAEAIQVATRLMSTNQQACFNVAEKKQIVKAAAGAPANAEPSGNR
jgi:hypothetical protein